MQGDVHQHVVRIALLDEPRVNHQGEGFAAWEDYQEHRAESILFEPHTKLLQGISPIKMAMHKPMCVSH